MMDVATIGRAATTGIVLSTTVFVAPALSIAAATNAASGEHTGKSPRQTRAVILNSATPERNCSWVGPGGRAIYVCR